MKRLVCMLLLVVMLAGCTGTNEELERAMDLRAKLIAGKVTFDAEITADYGDVSYTFSMNCSADTSGDMTFSVTAPQTVAGITGSVSAAGGKLSFDGTALAFDLMADGQITPVSAPWVLMKSLRGGYLSSCGPEGNLLRLAIDDSYEEDALHLEIWLDENDIPQTAEIYWEGRRLLLVAVSNFVIT